MSRVTDKVARLDTNRHKICVTPVPKAQGFLYGRAVNRTPQNMPQK